MGFWSTFATIAGDVGGSFIGDPMLGNQAVGLYNAIAGPGSGSSSTSGGSGPGGLLGVNGSQVTPPAANPAVQTGLDTLNSAKSNYETVLNGSQEATQSLLGPDVSTVLGQYDNAAKTAAELGPRGGGRTAVLAEAPFQKVAAYGKALAGAKQGAVQGLATIGQDQAQIGDTQTQLADQYRLGQIGVNATQNGNILKSQAATNAALAQIGSGIGSTLTNVISGQKAGGSSGGFGDATTSVTDNSDLSMDSQYAAGF